jgi:ABC-type transport system involved in cytochrome c biogenesis permease subunit
MRKIFPLLVLALGALYLASTLRPAANDTDFDFDAFGQLPVLKNGRIKPMDTVARTSLLMTQGRQRVTTPDGQTLTPVVWLLDTLFRPELADTYKTFEVVHPDLLTLMGVTPEDGDGKKRFSIAQLTPKLTELQRQAELAQPIDAAVRTPFQKAVVALMQHIVHYQRLKFSLAPPDSTNFLNDLTQFQSGLKAGVEAVRAQQAGQAFDQEAASRTLNMARRFDMMSSAGSLLAIPPDAGNPDPTAWRTSGEALLATFQTGNVNPNALAYAGLAYAWRGQQAEQFNTILKLYTDQMRSRFAEPLVKSDAEVRFNQAAPFGVPSMSLYVLAFLLAVFSWLRWPEALSKAAFYLIALAWVATTAGIATRMWLEGRPPVTNLYSSALFVGWGSVLLCLFLEAFYKNGVGSVAGGMIGFCTLVIAHHLSLSGDTLEMMRAVLDSNFWLATHVVVITIGYSATYLAGFLAIVYIARGVFTKSLDAGTADALSRMVYGIVCFATLFSLVGTILGGIWADQSWGRFWGWDPKENGALIIVIWNAVILHARWGGLVRQRGLMNLAIGGNIVTSWSWFGTNMLGVGLHSYGFMDSAFFWLSTFVGSQLAIMAVGSLPLDKWRSFAPKRDVAPPPPPLSAESSSVP